MILRRIEPLPACLFALATTALGLSVVLSYVLREPQEAARVVEPRRSSDSGRWPIEELPPIASPYIADTTPTQRSNGLSFLSFELSPAPATLSSDLLAVVTRPLPTNGASAAKRVAPTQTVESNLIVLLPRPRLLSIGGKAPRVVSRSMRGRWSIGPIDTLQVAERAGRLMVQRGKGLDGRQWMASLSAAQRLIDDAIAAAPAVRQPKAPQVSSPIRRPLAADIKSYLQAAESRGAFPVAMKLAKQLDRVAADRDSAPWAWAVAYHLRTLASAGFSDLDTGRALSRLSDAVNEALAKADTMADARRAVELRRAAYAVRRRVDAWRAEQVQTLVTQQLEVGMPLVESKRRLESARWAMSQEGLGLAPGVMLYERPPLLRVAERLERYEQRPTSALAAALAADAQDLAQLNGAHHQQVANAIEQNYRNANVRVAISEKLIERLLPEPEPVHGVVRDRIAGARVTGRSVTHTEIRILLSPDPSAWRIGLAANGQVLSHTLAHGGPAVLGSQGSTSFLAKKLVLLSPAGIRTAPAIAEAQTTGSRLVSVATNYDRVPLIGNYARSAARREYGKRRSRAEQQSRAKVERQVCDTLDSRVNTQLAELHTQYERDLAVRIERLGVRVDPIEMRTTEQRLIGRLRIAGDNQLAAHTPRMRAPSDSLVSVQLHESTLNNTLEGLGLAGARLTPADLRARIEERLGAAPRHDSHEPGVVLQFASEDPVRIELAEGQVHLTLALDAIDVRGSRHRNFRVHTYFRPQVNGLTAELVQEGAPQIEGRLRTASRLHLHGVFGKVLGEGGRVPLVRIDDRTPERIATALTGLATNQLVIEDGWLGLAIGLPRDTDRVALQVGGYVR